MSAQHTAVTGGAEEELNTKIRRLENQNQALKYKVLLLENELRGFRDGGGEMSDIEKRLVRRQLICSLYTALGHQQNDPREGTFDWLENGGGAEAFREISGWDRGQTQDLLELMDPRPARSIIRVGNDAAHTYSFDDAKRAVGDDEESLRRVIDFFTVQYGVSGDMSTAAGKVQRSLGRSNAKLGGLASWIKRWKQNRSQEQPAQVQGGAGSGRSEEGGAMDADWWRRTEK